jgi:hypothetical protein
MSKTFKYTKITSRYYLDYTDEWEEDGIEFDYEIDDYDLMNEIMPIIMREYFEGQDGLEEQIIEFIVHNDLVGFFADKYETELHDIFEKEAMDWYNG